MCSENYVFKIAELLRQRGSDSSHYGLVFAGVALLLLDGVAGFAAADGAALAPSAAGGAGGAVSAAFTEAGTLSEFASNTLTSQICVSVKRPLKPGIPVSRIPFSAFQYVSDAGSSDTPTP